MAGCICTAEYLCGTCRTMLFAQLGPPVAMRGRQWCDEMFAELPTDEPWPADTDAILAAALARVRDMSSDSQLRAALALELIRAAHARWSQLSIAMAGTRAG